MSSSNSSAHDSAISDQFTRQAESFAQSRALHAQDVVGFVVDAVAPKPGDRAIDLACGPGSVACALAARAANAVGMDATQAMLDEAAKLAAQRGLCNVEWVRSSVYRTPFPDGSFDIVTCRFAFHHFERPQDAFAEMARLAAPGARIAVCDGIVSDDPAKAHAFNAMEKVRDPSTVAFRSRAFLRDLFVRAGLGEPVERFFHVTYRARDLAKGSFPEGMDRDALQAMLEASVEGDTLGMKARRTEKGVELSYASVVLTAVKR
ncbi:MAG: methyltransferase domain-containing protein [Rhodoblastus sp.]|nr:methyltransferase domain-containing protein [Rhodoblastus sp.]